MSNLSRLLSKIIKSQRLFNLAHLLKDPSIAFAIETASNLGRLLKDPSTVIVFATII